MFDGQTMLSVAKKKQKTQISDTASIKICNYHVELLSRRQPFHSDTLYLIETMPMSEFLGFYLLLTSRPCSVMLTFLWGII